MSIVIYSKDNCSYCLKAKNFLRLEGIEFTELLIGKDITREDFMDKFPEQKSVPLIINNEEKIGGYNELVEYVNNN
jgi:glutaredoxin